MDYLLKSKIESLVDYIMNQDIVGSLALADLRKYAYEVYKMTQTQFAQQQFSQKTVDQTRLDQKTATQIKVYSPYRLDWIWIPAKSYWTIFDHINRNLKIQAIKELRSCTGMGLKDAKDTVEFEENWKRVIDYK